MNFKKNTNRVEEDAMSPADSNMTKPPSVDTGPNASMYSFEEGGEMAQYSSP
jgi:hypothetical protein